MVQDPQLAAHQRLQEMLSQVDGLLGRVNRLEPVAGSPAFIDLRRDRLHALAWQHGTVALAIACDSMRGLRLMASAFPRPVVAQMPLLRAAVDGASLARWLFDPAADHGERLRRALRVEEQDLVELDKAQRYGEGGTAFRLPVSRAAPRLAELRSTLKSRNLTAAPYREFAPSNLASRYASFPKGGSDSGAWLYATLSAVVHGRRWTLGLTQSRSDNPLDRLTPVTTRGNLALVTDLTAVVLDHLIVAIQDAEWYAGFGEPT